MAAPDLLDRWSALLPGREILGRELVERWAEPHRHYHDLSHLSHTLDAVDLLAAEASDPARVRLAVWFHDAVYDPRADDNEEQSARLVEARLGDSEVARLVRLTATHEPAADDWDGVVLCDADLAILGRDAETYDAYAAGVRREYAHVPDDDFRTGRTAILRRLAERRPLFRTERGREAWEDTARVNLERELQSLG